MTPHLFESVISQVSTMKPANRLVLLGWMFCALVAYGMAIHFLLVLDPQPYEYREGAALLLTQQLHASVNIYDFKHQPYDLNVYGPAYYWLADLLSPLIGTSYSAHRTLSAVFIFASCALIVWVFRGGRYGMAAGLVAACVWYAHTLRLYGIGARPDTLALLLYMLTVFVPWRMGFSRKSIFFAAACSILAFFTKPYLAAGIVYVIGYLLLQRHLRRATLTTVLYAAAFLALLAWANAIGDAYIYNTVFVNLGYAGTWNWPHVGAQALRFSALNLPLLLCIGYAIFAHRLEQSHGSSKSILKNRIQHDLQYPLFAAVCSLILLLRIAHNAGSAEYFIHLLSPIIVVAAYLFLASRGLMAAVLIAGILQVAILIPRFPHYPAQEWQAVQDMIASEPNILHSPSTVKYALARNETVFDSGQTEFFSGGLKKGEKYYPQASEAWVSFQENILGRVARKEFTLILLNANMPAIIEREKLLPHYKRCGTLPAPLYRHPENTLELWRPVCP
ncbi:MAG: hypothetical protein ACYCZS_04420 [Thiobacillus sp.]